MPKRPFIQAPKGGGILDEIAASTGNRPPFAARPAPGPVPQQAPPEPEPETDDEQETEPARRAAARPAARTRTRRTTAAAGIPEPPPGYVATRKPLQVYLPGGDHWNLKYGALVRGTDMSQVVAAMVSAWVADPDAWTALIARAEQERKSIGELLAPYLAQAVDDLA